MKLILDLRFTLLLLVLVFSCKNEQRKSLDSSEEKTIENIDKVRIPISAMEKFIVDKMEEMKIPGLSMAIINEGKIVYHTTQGYANIDEKQLVTERTLFEGASISKPMFAFLVMHLVEDRKLALDKPLYEYLDFNYPGMDYTDERHKQITARTVLSHSTGFPNWRGQSDLNIEFEPGTEFGYSGEGYQYLVKVVESVLDTDYIGLEAYFHKKVATPLKMSHTKYVQDEYNLSHKATPHKNGKVVSSNNMAKEFNAASAIHSEANEYSKWLIALMNQEGLTATSYNELFKDQIKTPKIEWFNKVGITHWTLGFAKHKFPFLENPIYGHIGNNEGFTSLFLIDLHKKWGIVIFTNADQADDFGFNLFKYLNKED